MNIFSRVVEIITILALNVVLMLVSSGIMVGAGYLFSAIFPLSLFQGIVVCLGTALLILMIYFFTSLLHLGNDYLDYMKYLDDEPYDDDFDEDDDEESDARSRLKVINIAKVGRNDPCPCGSGKKYKHC